MLLLLLLLLLLYDHRRDSPWVCARSIGLCDRFTNWGMCKRYPPKFNGNCIVVERAADPTNVLWEHLQFGTTNRVLRELVTTVAVLVLVGAASYATAYVKSPEAAEPGHIHENVFYKWGVPSFLATIPLSIITVAINAVIKKVYIHMAAWETHHHISGQEEWCMVKAAFGYVTALCCPVHAVSCNGCRRVARAGTGNTSTSCSCSGTCTDSRGQTRRTGA